MSIKTNRDESSHILFLLKTASFGMGVGVDPKQKKLEIVCRYFIITGFVFVCLCSIIEFVYVPHSKSELMEIFYSINASVSLLSTVIVTIKNKNELRLLYIKIEENYQQSAIFATVSNNLVSNVIRKYRFIVLYIYLLVTVLPVLITYTTDVEVGNIKSLIFPCWYPWNTRTKLGYLITMSVQLLTVTFAYMMVGSFTSFAILFVISIRIFLQQFENDLRFTNEMVSNEHIKNQKDAYEWNNKNNVPREDTDQEKKIKMKLSAVARRHKFIMK